MSTTVIFCLGSGKGMEWVVPPRISGADSDLGGLISDDDDDDGECCIDDDESIVPVAVYDAVDASSCANIDNGSRPVSNCRSVITTVHETQNTKKVAVSAMTGCFRRAHRLERYGSTEVLFLWWCDDEKLLWTEALFLWLLVADCFEDVTEAPVDRK